VSVLGARLIKHCIIFGSFAHIIGEGIETAHFMGDTCDAWEYTKSAMIGGRTPTVTEICERFRVNMEAPVVGGDLFHLCDMVKKRHILNKMSPHIEAGMRKVERNDVAGALADFEQLQHLKAELIRDEFVHSFRMSADSRLESYYKSRDSLNAIPCMWPSFNKWAGGWTDATFFVISAHTTIGKN